MKKKKESSPKAIHQTGDLHTLKQAADVFNPEARKKQIEDELRAKGYKVLTAEEVAEKEAARLAEPFKSEVKIVPQDGEPWKIHTTATLATTKESGIAAVVLFESENQLKKLFAYLEGGFDPCRMGWKNDDPPNSWKHYMEQKGVKIRVHKGETFVDAIMPNGTRKRVPAKLMFDGMIEGRRSYVQVMNKDGTLGDQLTLAEFITQRERLRKKSENALAFSSRNMFNRSVIPSSQSAKVLAATEKQLLARNERGEYAAIEPVYEPYDPMNGTSRVLREFMATVSTEDALEISCALDDESRSRIDALETVSRKKQRSNALSCQLLFDFEREVASIDYGTAKAKQEQVHNLVNKTIRNAMTLSLMQLHKMLEILAIEEGGTTIKNMDRLLELRYPNSDGGKQWIALNEELEELAKIKFILSYRRKDKKGIYTRLTFNILTRGTREEEIDTLKGTKKMIRQVWKLDPDFFALMNRKSLFTITDKTLLGANTLTQEWEIRFYDGFTEGWAKGWLGSENLFKVSGRKTWRVGSFIDAIGLGMTARAMLYGTKDEAGKVVSKAKGKKAFRDKIRETLQSLQRFGRGGEEVIGDYEYNPRESSDPMEDAITVSPTDSWVASFTDRVLGRAVAKKKAADLLPPKPTKLLPK